jgi:hypothetical protein
MEIVIFEKITIEGSLGDAPSEAGACFTSFNSL